MSFEITQVKTRQDKKKFLQVAREIYNNDPVWICPLDIQIDRIFNPAHNTYFLHGMAERWVVQQNDKLAGRIAAFIDERKINNSSLRVGGIGFFECINDHRVAHLLFDTAIAWLKSKNIEAVDGPVNFGENDRYWGLMTEGFTEVPFTTNYNKPYYHGLFEEYGFNVYYEMFTSEIDLGKPMDERFSRIAEWVQRKTDVCFQHPTMKSLPRYADHFREIYNEAWQFHDGFTPMTKEQAQKFAREMKNVLIPELIPFAFVRNEPAGFIAGMPDLNQIFRSFNGKAGLIRLLQFKWRSRNNFSWYLKRSILTRVHAIAIGVKPKFQQYGLETGLMLSSLEKIRKMGFKKIELRWAGDFNPKIIRLHKAIGAVRNRKHVTYRYVFNEAVKITAPATIPMGRVKAK